MSLRSRLWLVLTALVLLPLVVGGLLVILVMPSRLDDAAFRTVEVGVASASAGVARDCERLGTAGRSAGLAVVGGQQPQEALSGVLVPGLIDYAAFLDADGTAFVEAGTPPAGGVAASSCSAGQASSGGLAERIPAQITAWPRLASILVVENIDAEDIASLRTGLATRAHLVLGDSTGAVVASSANEATSRRLLDAARDHGKGDTRSQGALLSSRPPKPGVPFTVVVSTPRPDRSRIVLGVVAIIVGGVLMALVIGRRLARSLTLPLAEATAAAERVASGNLDTRLRVVGDDEVGRLARSFNEMTTELAAQRAEVERSHEEVRSGLERMETMLQSTHDLERLLQVVLATALSATRAQGGVVCAVEPDGSIAVVASQGLADGAGRGLRVGEGILGRVAEGGVAVGKVGTSADLLPVEAEPEARFVLGVPIRRGGRVAGVLAVYDRFDVRSGTTVAFGRDQVREIRSLAGSASAAFENVLLHQEAQRASITDPLTGLGNYRLLSTTLAREIERSQRFSRPLSVLMLDIDHFKLVNDTYGHPRGDAVLKELAERLQEQLREVDLLARYGGEEFAVILPETDRAGASSLALRIGDALRSRPFTQGGDPIPVTASIGVAVLSRDRSTPAMLMRAADTALYVAKNGGRDTWAIAVDGFQAVPGQPARLG